MIFQMLKDTNGIKSAEHHHTRKVCGYFDHRKQYSHLDLFVERDKHACMKLTILHYSLVDLAVILMLQQSGMKNINFLSCLYYFHNL